MHNDVKDIKITKRGRWQYIDLFTVCFKLDDYHLKSQGDTALS